MTDDTGAGEAERVVTLGFQRAPRHLVCEYFAIQRKLRAGNMRLSRLIKGRVKNPHGIGFFPVLRNASAVRKWKHYNWCDERLHDLWQRIFQRIIKYGETP